MSRKYSATIKAGIRKNSVVTVTVVLPVYDLLNQLAVREAIR